VRGLLPAEAGEAEEARDGAAGLLGWGPLAVPTHRVGLFEIHGAVGQIDPGGDQPPPALVVEVV
jgi:hypothetical protein